MSDATPATNAVVIHPAVWDMIASIIKDLRVNDRPLLPIVIAAMDARPGTAPTPVLTDAMVEAGRTAFWHFLEGVGLTHEEQSETDAVRTILEAALAVKDDHR